MVSRRTPTSPVQRSGQSNKSDLMDNMVIERSDDPLQLLANILEVAGALAAQWGNEIELHLRVASLWLRINRKEMAISYLHSLAMHHLNDNFHLGFEGVNLRIDMMHYFFSRVEIDDALLLDEEAVTRLRRKNAVQSVMFWRKDKRQVRKVRKTKDARTGYTFTTLSPEEEEIVNDILRPSVTWLENAYLTPVPGDTRFVLVQELNNIKEYLPAEEMAERLLALFDHCRGWHERKSDTPIWVHDLDDIGTRAMYLAVMSGNPHVIITYILRCIDALNERPLALMHNVAVAIAGLGYMAKKQRSDEVLHRALDFLPRLPEHERCLAALALVEVLVERG